jgi:hypothetical protein
MMAGANAGGNEHFHVAFRPLRDRECTVEVGLAWRANAPGAVRESFLALLRDPPSRGEAEPQPTLTPRWVRCETFQRGAE